MTVILKYLVDQHGQHQVKTMNKIWKVWPLFWVLMPTFSHQLVAEEEKTNSESYVSLQHISTHDLPKTFPSQLHSAANKDNRKTAAMMLWCHKDFGAFLYAGPVAWNSLPLNFCFVADTAQFMKQLKNISLISRLLFNSHHLSLCTSFCSSLSFLLKRLCSFCNAPGCELLVGV